MNAKRILVIGNNGAGKTTFSKRLGKALDIQIISLDTLFWLPGWQPMSAQDFDSQLDSLLKQDSWILDGNYYRTLETRLHYADTVIFLDYNRFVCFWRCMKRWLFDCYEQSVGCKPKMDIKFAFWVVAKYNRRKRKIVEYQKRFPELNWIVFKNSRQVESFLNEL